MTRKERILRYLKNPETVLSCQEISVKIIKAEKLTGSVKHYISGPVSTVLAKMVKDKILQYADGTTERGGHLYQLDTRIDTSNPCYL